MGTFATFRWGVSRDSILKRLGQPRAQDSTGGVVRLTYFDLLLGERTMTVFTVSPLEGLIEGNYWVPLPEGRNCEVFFRKFYFALAERFEGIKPQAARTQTARKPFCGGVVDGSASLTALWKDPKSDAAVSAQLVKLGKYVKIQYVGPPYAVWAKRPGTADLKDKL